VSEQLSTKHASKWKNVLFPCSSAPWILIHKRRVHDCTLLDALLNPQIRLNILVWYTLVHFDEVLENLGVGIRENDASGLSRGGRIAARMLSHCPKSAR
jgi:hypothetical protein